MIDKYKQYCQIICDEVNVHNLEFNCGKSVKLVYNKDNQSFSFNGQWNERLEKVAIKILEKVI